MKENVSALKKFIGQSSIYMVGGLIARMSAFITLPILTRTFSKSEYGLMSIIMLTVSLLAAISKFGMQHSTVRFYDEFRLGKRQEGFPTYYSTIFWGTVIVAVIIAGLFIAATWFFPFIFREKVPLSLFLIIGGLTVSEAMRSRVNNFLRVEQRTKLFVIMGIVLNYGRVMLGLLFLFAVARNIESFFAGELVVGLVITPLLAVMLFGGDKLRPTEFSYPFFKENVSYGYPMIGFEMSSLMMKFADRYLVQIFLGAAALGLYSVTGNLAMAVSEGVFAAIWLTVSPMFMQIWSEHGDEKTREFLSKVIKLLSLLCIPMIFGIAAISTDVVKVLASSKFVEAAPTLPYLVAGAVLWGFCPIVGAGLYIHKKTKKLNNMALIGTIFNFAINLFVIPRWGIMGAAITTLITYVIVIFLIFKASSLYLKVGIDPAASVHFIFASLCMYLVLVTVPLGISLVNLILKVIGGAVIYCGLVFLMNTEIRNLGKKTLQTVLKPLGFAI